MSKEQTIQRRITKAWEKKKGWCCKVVSANKNGVPDVVGVIPIEVTQEMVGSTIGAFFACEVKTPRGKTSPIQDYQISKIIDAGGKAIVARSVEDFLENCL